MLCLVILKLHDTNIFDSFKNFKVMQFEIIFKLTLDKT